MGDEDGQHKRKPRHRVSRHKGRGVTAPTGMTFVYGSIGPRHYQPAGRTGSVSGFSVSRDIVQLGAKDSGRSERIRTSGPCVPNTVICAIFSATYALTCGVSSAFHTLIVQLVTC